MKFLLKHKTFKHIIGAGMLAVLAVTVILLPTRAYADNISVGGADNSTSSYGCGSNDPNGLQGLVHTTIDLGCDGNACAQGSTTGYCSTYHNSIIDMLFAIIRLLSAGVGIIVIASIVVGGFQYTVSRGDPNATSAAIGRIRTSLIALLIYIFAFAILNYVIPNGFFNQ